MQDNPTRSAFLVIDMERGFLSAASPHCIPAAAATVPAIVRAMETARSKGIPIVFVKRLYRADSSDVELTRWQSWAAGGRAMTSGSVGPVSAQAPAGLRPKPGDYTVIKPRWSAFFQTELDLLLRRLGVRTVILTGTTTPNCVRATAYDANALDYNVIVLADCTSSRNEEVQRVNLEDMACMGAVIMTEADFRHYGQADLPDPLDAIRADMTSAPPPETFAAADGNVAVTDVW